MLLKDDCPCGGCWELPFWPACFSLPDQGSAKALVDLNTASAQELDTLKGIGPATAKKIIDNRPYTSVNDLTKAGLSAKEIETLKPLVTVTAAKTAGPAATAPEKSAKPGESGNLIDLNTASQRELEAFPGSEEFQPTKLLPAAPMPSINDLTKAGIAEKNIAHDKTLVTISPAKKAARDRRSPKNRPSSGAGQNN